MEEKNYQLALFIGLIILFANILGLWGTTILSQRRAQQQQAQLTSLSRFLTDEQPPSSLPIQPTPALIDQSNPSAVDSTQLTALQTKITSLEQQLAELQEKVNATPTPNSSSSSVKEAWLPIGSGSTTSTDWTSVDSAIVTLDLGKYPAVKEAYWEGALSIIGGNASARLINQSGGGVISGSEISHNSSKSTWKTSAQLSLPAGKSTIVVQLRSSSSEKAELANSRLHLIFE